MFKYNNNVQFYDRDYEIYSNLRNSNISFGRVKRYVCYVEKEILISLTNASLHSSIDYFT